MRKPFTAIRAEMHIWPTPMSAANETRTAEQEGPKWAAICPLDEIPRLGARVVRRGVAPNIAVFRSASDQLFALADRCPHRGGPLSQGIVYGERVACPLHNTSVELGTGCAVAPDKGQVQRFAVKLVAGIVYVDLEPHTNGNS
jgi:nitrite reductase (NADH) small subunit